MPDIISTFIIFAVLAYGYVKRNDPDFQKWIEEEDD